MRIDKLETAFGFSFHGANYSLGQFVSYRTKSQYKPKLEPNAQPALMAGWKLKFGLRCKGVLAVLGYDALREGKIVCGQAPEREATLLFSHLQMSLKRLLTAFLIPQLLI